MKKFVAILLVLGTLGAILAGCKGDDAGAETTGTTGETTTGTTG